MSGFESAILLLKEAHGFLTSAIGYGIVVWLLAGVFTLSGIVKLRKPVLAAMAMVDFGVVGRVYPLLGSVLGAVEMLLAFALALKIIPRLTLLFTTLLLIFFTLLIARSLWTGKDFACYCFAETDEKLSRWTLARTGVLALLAGTVAYVPIPPDLYRGFQVNVFLAVTAVSLLGTIALIAHMPRLIDWGRDSFKAEENRVPEVKA